MHTLWSITLRKVSKIGAAKRQILRLKCTSFDSRWALSQTPLEEFTALSKPPKGPTSKGNGGEEGKG